MAAHRAHPAHSASSARISGDHPGPAEPPERWRFVVRRRDPRRANLPCGWIVGFGTWSPDDSRVTVCRLDPPCVESTRSIDDYLRDLAPELALVWTDLFDPVENSSPDSRQNPRRHVS